MLRAVASSAYETTSGAHIGSDVKIAGNPGVRRNESVCGVVLTTAQGIIHGSFNSTSRGMCYESSDRNERFGGDRD